MPLPLLAPVVAALVGAALSEEIAHEEEVPRWTIDIPDGVFDRVDEARIQGSLIVDFLARKVRGIAWVTPFPAERTDWVVPVGRLMATDVADWVRDRLDLLERYRPAVLAGEGEDALDSFSESLDAAKYGPIRVIESVSDLLSGVADNQTSLHEVFFVLRLKGASTFISGHGDTTYVTGTPAQQAEEVRRWVSSRFESAMRTRSFDLPKGSVETIPVDETEVLALLGEPLIGFDVVFDLDQDEEWVADAAESWGLVRVQRSDGSFAWRYSVRA